MPSILLAIAIFSTRYEVDPAFMCEVMRRESAYNQFAIGDIGCPTGPSLGYWQFQKGTFVWAYGKVYGGTPRPGAEFDVMISTRCAAWLMSEGYSKWWTAGKQMISEGWEVAG